MASRRITSLVAFDFDHTVVDGNTDVEVQKLAPDGIPSEIKETYSSHGWTKFMGNIFKHLHDNGVTKHDMFDNMDGIKFTPGMKELFNFCNEKGYEIIIISDSNSVFIDHILRANKLDPFVSRVYTNPAQFNKDGLLEIDFYHVQDWCDLSTVNLCKGHILESHIKERLAENVSYDRIVYVGDGTNDLCPCLRLSEKDLACARRGFRLIKKINAIQNDEDATLDLKAQVLGWDSGHEIVEALKQVDKPR